jgi:hypothetical protein
MPAVTDMRSRNQERLRIERSQALAGKLCVCRRCTLPKMDHFASAVRNEPSDECAVRDEAQKKRKKIYAMDRISRRCTQTGPRKRVILGRAHFLRCARARDEGFSFFANVVRGRVVRVCKNTMFGCEKCDFNVTVIFASILFR